MFHRSAYVAPTTDESGDSVSTCEGYHRKEQPPVVKHGAGVWEATPGSDPWKAVPLSRMLIKSEAVPSMIRSEFAV